MPGKGLQAVVHLLFQGADAGWQGAFQLELFPLLPGKGSALVGELVVIHPEPAAEDLDLLGVAIGIVLKTKTVLRHGCATWAKI